MYIFKCIALITILYTTAKCNSQNNITTQLATSGQSEDNSLTPPQINPDQQQPAGKINHNPDPDVIPNPDEDLPGADSDKAGDPKLKWMGLIKQMEIGNYLAKRRRKPEMLQKLESYYNRTNDDSSEKNPRCRLRVLDEYVHDKIAKKVNDDSVVLIEYTMIFPEYNKNPLEVNMTTNYKANVWQRAFDKHGRTLLKLTFNYAIQSLTMLTYGVAQMDIAIVDVPPACYGQLTENEKVEEARKLVMADFQTYGNQMDYIGTEDFACHYTIQNVHGHGEFRYLCCNDAQRCTHKDPERWITLLTVLMVMLKIAFIFFAPHVIIKMSFLFAFHIAEYKVDLLGISVKERLSVMMSDAPTKKTNNDHRMICCLTSYHEENEKTSQTTDINKRIDIKGAEDLSESQDQSITMKHLLLTVDHNKLMSETNIPVGFFRFIWEQVLRCGFTNAPGIQGCCSNPIFRTTSIKKESPPQYWPIFRGALREEKPRQQNEHSCLSGFTWRWLLQALGMAVSFCIIILPYYLRVRLYYAHEHREILQRKQALDNLGLEVGLQMDVIHLLDPSHLVMQLIYYTGLVCFAVLLFLHQFNKRLFSRVIFRALTDICNIRRMACFELLGRHIVFPILTWGCWGFLYGIPYWIITIPTSLIVSVLYCVPTIYMFFRLPIADRIGLTNSNLIPKDWSLGTTISDCFMLDKISPNLKESTRRLYDKEDGIADQQEEKNRSETTPKSRSEQRVIKIVIGLMGFVCMYVFILVMAEAFGYILEVIILTMMGGIVNASSAANFIMLVFWCVVYSNNCYKSMYEKYQALNTQIFKYLKDRFEKDINRVIYEEEKHQPNMGFIYTWQPPNIQSPCLNNNVTPEIRIENGERKWHVSKLVFFVDSEDMPWIPRSLFYNLCAIEAPGCPGPIYKSFFMATQHLCYMAVFLMFVMGVIMSFTNAYEMSSTNQLLITAAGGFLPFIIKTVLIPAQAGVNLDTYAFNGQIHNIIQNFRQSWPVSQFQVSRASEAAVFKEENGKVENTKESEANHHNNNTDNHGNHDAHGNRESEMLDSSFGSEKDYPYIDRSNINIYHPISS